MQRLKNYPGGKNGSGVYQNIINLIPKHDIYVEGFLGSGAILINKKYAKYSICLDRNEKCLDVGRKMNIPGSTFINQDTISYLKSFLSMVHILRNYDASCFIYLDPPYPFNVRKSKKKIYKYEFNTRDHNRLIDVIGSSKTPIMISSYKNELYDNRLREWNRIDFSAVTRKGKVTESVYINYDTAGKLHDYRYIGKDFREREKFRGIIFRNVSKINRLPDPVKSGLIDKLRETGII